MTADDSTISRPSARERLERWVSPANVVAFAVLVSIPVKLMRDRLDDPDLWWHMQTGALILDRGLPRVDPYSYTAPGKEWIVQGWGADVLLELTRRAWGLWGPFMFRAVAVTTLYVIVSRMLVRRMGSGIATWALLALTAYAGAPNWTERPNLLSFLLFAATLWLVDRRDDRLWLFVPLAALWANLHGMVILGIGLVGLTAVTETIKVLARAGDADERAAKRAWLVTIGSVVAMMLNPVGWKLVVHTLRLVGIAQNIAQEWQSPSFHQPGSILFLLLVFGVIVMLARRHTTPDLTDVALVLVFIALPLHAQRNLLVGAIVIGTRLAKWIGEERAIAASRVDELRDVEHQRRDVGERTGLLIGASAAVATALIFALILVDGLPRSGHPDDIVEETYPVALIDKLKVPGVRVLSHDGWSGMVIDRAWPEARVFVDLRWDFYGSAIAERFSEVVDAQPEALEVLDESCTTHVLLLARNPATRLLQNVDGWRAVARDTRDGIPEIARGTIFERTEPAPGCPGPIPRVR